MSFSRRFPRSAVAAALLPLLLPATAGAAGISGTVASGKVPLAGSAVRLFAAGSGPAAPLGSARSASDGSWSIDYRAPDGAQLYVLATGGSRRGVRHGQQLRLLAVAGAASAIGEQPTLALDERSTVAGAYALARFADGAGNVGGPSPGLQNAIATAANLFEARAGRVSFVLGNAPNGLLTEALPTFNTLANLLATCGSGTARDCRALFAAARAPGARRPANTLAAALAFARSPWRVTSAQVRLAIPRRARRAPFGPALSAAPKAWTIVIQYTGSGLNAPGRMAFAADGTIWAGNNFQSPGTTAGLELTALTPTGQPIPGSPFSGGGLRGMGWGTAVGLDGRIWNSNFSGGSISVNAADGRTLSPDGGYTAGDPQRPQGVAVAPNGDVWIANFGGDSVIRYPKGIPDRATAQVITGGGIVKPFAIQVDDRGYAWVTNGAESARPGSVTVIAPDGRTLRNVSGGGLRSPQGLALDSAGNAWIANLLSASVTRISRAGRVSSDSPLRSSVQGGWGIAVDGADHVWVAGFFGGNVTELCGIRRSCPPGVAAGRPISPARGGYDSAAFEHITAVQVDQSGNVWLANNWTTASPLSQPVGGAGLAQIVGAATPVKTPLVGLPLRP
ncbi:hypothetical protein Q5424_23530 [Conexibacter sp. JD483]|uniref:Vgb family protein n=1 Tax=unclassified Conexibacter TaxID=2627773 RepID=UPI00271B410D|nr:MULTISPECIES: hypothetical protein [unclassified Conexibacter]MDO8185683.1 hypothetical protein [Conexibacter sp. CPCC 205706]MDO8198856.1 hypothetical protein [Conexibacter sp. CPCC 205762]MDR9372089.1 hypothetical protein [Conexibacter sp. JD483]